MPITYKYDDLRSQVITDVNGVIYSAEIVAYFNEVLGDERITADFIEVVRFNADDLILKFSDLEKLQVESHKLLMKGHKITFFCAYDNFSQNISKMMGSLFSSLNLSLDICTTEESLKKYISALELS